MKKKKKKKKKKNKKKKKKKKRRTQSNIPYLRELCFPRQAKPH